MKTKIALSMLVILFVIAASLGATMAWFTDEASVPENIFEAGTVLIEADETWEYGDKLENWNPGDCTEKIITVENSGTKAILVRAQFNESWTLKYELDENGNIDKDENGDPIEIEDPQPIFPDDSEWEDVVNMDLNDNEWFFVDDLNDEANGYWYYDGVLEAGEVPDPITFITEVCLSGDADNKFQGATYTLEVTFEAIQASNNASGDAWGIDSIYDPEDETTSDNWDSWNYPAE